CRQRSRSGRAATSPRRTRRPALRRRNRTPRHLHTTHPAERRSADETCTRCLPTRCTWLPWQLQHRRIAPDVSATRRSEFFASSCSTRCSGRLEKHANWEAFATRMLLMHGTRSHQQNPVGEGWVGAFKGSLDRQISHRHPVYSRLLSKVLQPPIVV